MTAELETIITSDHAIFKYASYYDELGTWLPYADDLIRMWATQTSDEIVFRHLELFLAYLLHRDLLLPPSAITAFENRLLDKPRPETPDELRWAADLLSINLLHGAARRAFAQYMLAAMDEAINRKYTLKSLGIKPEKPGRKSATQAIFQRNREVNKKIKELGDKTKAYREVAEKHHLAIDTIRRTYERQMKKQETQGLVFVPPPPKRRPYEPK